MSSSLDTPLSGVRIVSLAQNVPGPVAVSRLAGDGATVVKVEPPAGDPLATMSRAWYEDIHGGVDVRRLDLKSPAGAAELDTLLEDAHLLITGQRPAALARLGLAADQLAGRFPRLRTLAIVGSTAEPDAAGHDVTYQAKAGLLQNRLPATLLADLVGAERVYSEALLLLRSPAGTRRDVGLYDSLEPLTAPLRHALTTPGGPLGGGLAAYGVYPAREGHVAIAALEPQFRRRLYEALGRPIDGPLATAFLDRSAAEWQQWAAEHDIPLAALLASTPSGPPAQTVDVGYEPLLDAAHRHAAEYLAHVRERHVNATATRAELLARLGGPLPDRGIDATQVIDHLARDADPGIIASVGPRYFGFVTGGALPVAVAADWLTSAWDQNGALYVMSPAVAVMEDVVAGWTLDLLGLPSSASVGLVTGCHMANFTCLAAARHEVLHRAGWNVESRGLREAPRVRVIVGDEVHVSAVGALRLLGFGTETLERVPVDGQGRMHAGALAATLAADEAPTIVCAQVGNVSTGASDPVAEIIGAAHARGAWVHVDGAFGLWAAAVPELKAQVRGVERADSWATDAHKWLNVPYDSGLAIVAHAAPHRAAMGLAASYLQRGDDEERVGMDWVPESSRRARVVPLYAAIRALGRQGVADLVRRTVMLARRMAARLSQRPGVTVLNDVVLNQVLVQFSGVAGQSADEVTRRVIAMVQADGTCWAGGAVWQGKQAMRIAVSNWSTTEDDIDRSAEAILASHAAAAAGPP